MKPGFCQSPVTFDGCGSDAQNVCCLFNGESAEIAQLDHACFLCIERCKGLQSVVERDQFSATLHCSIDIFVQREFLKILATLFCVVLARMVHQQATHYLSSDSEEVSPVLPVHPRLIDQLQVRLVHQRGWLQSVVGPFAPQIICRKLSQFIVDDG